METYYIFDEQTFEYTETIEVLPNRIPFNGTQDQLPKHKENEKVVRIKGEWKVFTPKQWTQHLVLLGHKSMSENEMVDASGEIVPKPKTQAQINLENIARIDAELARLDVQGIRALREYVITGDKSRVEELESQAIVLREERKQYT
jgi:hypothetical protein